MGFYILWYQMPTWTIVTFFLLHRKPHSSRPGRLHLDWRPHTGTGDSQEVHTLAHLQMSSFHFPPLSLLLFIFHLPLTFLVHFVACPLQNHFIIILLFFPPMMATLSLHETLPGLWYGVWSLTLLTAMEPNPLLVLFFPPVCFLLWKVQMSSVNRVFYFTHLPLSSVCQLALCGWIPTLCLTPVCRSLVTKTAAPAPMEDRR